MKLILLFCVVMLEALFAVHHVASVRCYQCGSYKDSGPDCNSKNRTVLAQFDWDCELARPWRSAPDCTHCHYDLSGLTGEATWECAWNGAKIPDNTCLHHPKGGKQCVCTRDYCAGLVELVD